MSPEPQPDVECLGCEAEWEDAEEFLEDLNEAVDDLPQHVRGNPEVGWHLKRTRRQATVEQATEPEDWTLMVLCVSCLVEELTSQGVISQEAG